MNKKHLLFFLFQAVCVIAMTASCTGGAKGESLAPMAIDSVSVEETDTTPPMFVLGINDGHLQMVYWEDLKEPVKDQDNAEYFDEIHQRWAFQDQFRRNAKQYTKLIVDGTKTRDVKYVDEVLLNPDGEPIFYAELHSRPEIPSIGARYVLQGEPKLKDELPGIVLVTESYLATHKPMAIKYMQEHNYPPMPATVVKQMEEKYGMKAERSQQICTIGDRYTYGTIQFKGEYKKPEKKDPEDKLALALEVICDGETVYSFPVEGWYDESFGPTWNADDGGEYFPSKIEAAFDGPKGPEFCYVHWAPESATTGRFLIRDGKLDRQEYTVYHSLIDEPLPVWKKDIEEMKRLYVADDPGENKHVELTKWAHVYIDYDGEQIWISDKDEENGAFFSRENGKLKLISTVRANLKPSFPESRNGNHYLMLSGSAGGPSYYTEIFKFKGGKVVEKFNAMEIYGEIDECSLNGKTISKEQGKAYMNAVPDATEPYIFWQEIEE